jgi:hypothetical protein
MPNLRKLAALAQKQIDKRGGNDVAKQDLKEVGGILKGKGTLADKAKRSADALKQPGAKDAPAADPERRPAP